MRTIASILIPTLFAFIAVDQAGQAGADQVNEWLDTNLWSQTTGQ